jgi:hypothetical protein
MNMLGYFEEYITYFMVMFSIIMERLIRLIRLIKKVLSKFIHFFVPDVKQDVLEYGAGI